MSVHTHHASADIRRQELERITTSRLFTRAQKLQQLVRWLGERSIAGSTARVTEYQVGVEALGKSRDFDPSFDVSVRQLKRRLCARLSNYYATEGSDSRLRLVCDRGFSVRFEPAPARSPKLPCLAVMSLAEDESGIVAGLLCHALHEAGGVQIIGRSAPVADTPNHLRADFLIEGEVQRDSGGDWEMTLRIVEAAKGLVCSGHNIRGNGPIRADSIRGAAKRLVESLVERERAAGVS